MKTTEKEATSKMGAKALAEGRSDLLRVAPHNLVVDPDFNVREDTPEYEAHIRWLADSIRAEGVKEPLKASYVGGRLIVRNGHSRLRAIDLLKGEGFEVRTVPVQLEDRYASEADVVLTLITSNSGRPLTPLETAKVYRRLIALGWSEDEVARRAGVSRTSVVRTLELNAVPTEVREMVRRGEVSATLAVDEVRKAKKKGDVGAATTKLSGAVEKAKANGKKKATNKDVAKSEGKAGVTPAKALRLVRDELWSAAVEEAENTKVYITIERDGWKAIADLVGYYDED